MAPRRAPIADQVGHALSREEKRTIAFQMRLGGGTFAEIAEAMGWRSQATAHEMVTSVLNELKPAQDDVDRMRTEQHERLLVMLRSRWDLAVEQGDDKAYELILKTIAQINKLYGLERPLQITTTKVEKEISSVDEEIIRLCEQMGGKAPANLDD